MSWATTIQPASFKGVVFDVLSVDDSLERAVAEHAYPFIHGADLEDMGLNPLTVKMQAVFFGQSFFTRYQQLLKALQETGAGVLVHPLRGRLPNMLLVSANLRTEAENINYVALDLTFREAGEAQPIFLLEEGFLSKIDRFLLALENLFNAALDWWHSITDAIANVKARLLGVWGGLVAIFEVVRNLFGLDKKKYRIAASTSARTCLSDSKKAFAQLKEMVSQGIQSRAALPALSFASQFLNLTAAVDSVQAVAAQVAQDESFNRSKTVKLRSADTLESGLMLDFISGATLMALCVKWLETQSDSLLIGELEQMNQTVRHHCLRLINALRAQQQAANAAAKNSPTSAVYESAEIAINQVRTLASQFTAMVRQVINQKPPLTLKQVAEGGTIHKIAHQFYGDYTRAGELLRLNAQIRQPNFIATGEWLNAYSV